MFYEWSETVTLVPYVNFRSFDFSLKADSADWKDTHYGDKGIMFDIALGANIKVNEDNLLIFGVAPYSYAKYEPSDPPEGTSYKVTETQMPVFLLGLESDVKDWLTFRAGTMKGFAKYETKTESEDATDTRTNTYSWFNFYMGLGFHVGDFDIDALIDNELPFRIGYWLTGYNAYDYYGMGPVYMVTTAYHF